MLHRVLSRIQKVPAKEPLIKIRVTDLGVKIGL